MKYNVPYGKPEEVVYGDQPYINGNPSTGTMGSIPPAASIEYPQRELVNLITDAGIVPDNVDLHQTAKAVQAGRIVYGVDSGAVNLISIALTPPLTAYIDGMHVWVRVAITNTGPAVCSINGLGGRNIVRRGGTAVQPGDLPGSYMSLLVYNGPHGNFELYGVSYAPASFVPILSANSNLYCNPTTGDDTLYDGTAPTTAVPPHGPFKTIGRAMVETFKYGPSVYTMTINLSAGTFPEAVATPNVIGPTTIIKGAGMGATMVTGANSRHTFQVSAANFMNVQDLTISCQGGSGPPCCLTAVGGASMISNNIAISGNVPGYVFEAYSGYNYPGNTTFNAGVSVDQVFGAFFGGNVGIQQSVSFSIAGAMTVRTAWAVASANGSIAVPYPTYPSFPGAGFVTGPKYLCGQNGVISVQGLGVGFFPGSVAGSLNTGGQYN